jgi:Flp pilus assembly protein TadD
MRHLLSTLVVTALFVGAWPSADVAAGRDQAPAKPNAYLLQKALDEYFQGQFDSGLKKIMESGFTVAEVQRWVNAGSRATQERRRLAAATVTLEYAARRFYLIPQLLTWARPLVAGASAPTATEAVWLRASIALSEGHTRWAFLTTGTLSQSPAAAAAEVSKGAVGHLSYASQRLPDDPYVKMAQAVAAEYLTSRATPGASSRFDRGTPGFDKFGADLNDTLSLRNAGHVPTLERAAAVLGTLLPHDVLGDEAHLRLGYIQLRLGQNDSALQHFDRVTTTAASPAHRYLGHLFAGLALARVNRGSEAATSYRAALRLVPRARSATTLLTSVLLMHGQMAEAELVATEFIGGTPAAVDPWDRYFIGDFPQFPQLIARLKEALR